MTRNSRGLIGRFFGWLRRLARPSRPELVYIAGPITNGGRIKDFAEQQRNVERACTLADSLLKQGKTPIVPQLSLYWDMLFPKAHCDWLAYDKRLILSCSELIRLPGPSKGADEEVDFARENGIPVTFISYFDIDDIEHLLETWDNECNASA